MAEQTSLDVEWLLDREATPEEVAAVTHIIFDEGLPGPVKAVVSEKGLEDNPWIIVALTPIALFLKGFFEESGRIGYHDLRRLVARLYGARRIGSGHVELSDRDSLTTIVFGPDLTEEAFKQLSELGLDCIQGKYWVWDPDHGCWRSQAVDGE